MVTRVAAAGGRGAGAADALTCCEEVGSQATTGRGGGGAAAGGPDGTGGTARRPGAMPGREAIEGTGVAPMVSSTSNTTLILQMGYGSVRVVVV
jgi:hypothetical protein